VALPLILVLNFYRLFPAAITYLNLDDPFLSGYPTLADVLRALVVIKRPSMDLTAGLSSSLNWWEMDVFVGLIGLGFLLFFGIYKTLKPDGPELRFSALDLPNAVMALFSINNFYYLIAQLPLPFAGVERIPSRFLILPITVVLLISTVRLDRSLRRIDRLRPVHPIAVVCIVQLYLELMTHLRHWNVAAVDVLLPATSLLNIHTVQVTNDQFYVTSLWASYVVTVVGMAICGGLYLKSRRVEIGSTGP